MQIKIQAIMVLLTSFYVTSVARVLLRHTLNNMVNVPLWPALPTWPLTNDQSMADVARKISTNEVSRQSM